jgi:1-acyl-sn-glycerol-3-phosphate acyltransferase
MAHNETAGLGAGHADHAGRRTQGLRPHREVDDAPAAAELERSLASLSADELVAALGLADAPAPVRALTRAGFAAVSAPLGRALARFDHRIATRGLPGAAGALLDDLGARWSRVGQVPPARGPLLVVANHPGAYDALVLLAAIERDDVAIVASDRAFLRAMPALRRHLVLVPDVPSASTMRRAIGLRRALAHLARGGALLHFGAGRIEPDPAFQPASSATWVDARDERLAPWQSGTGTLARATARASGSVVAALVGGVHSARAKRLLVTRLAERRGLTTLAPLLQGALRRYRDVDAVVRFGDAVHAREIASGDDATMAAKVREAALALWPSSVRADERDAEGGDRLGPRR